MSAYNGAVLADSPVAFWPLNETSGNPDSLVGSFPLTPTGTITYRQADIAGLHSLKGATGYLNRTGSPTTAVDNWTLEIIWRPLSLAANHLLFYNGASGTNGYGFYVVGTALHFLFGGVADVDVTETVATNTTYHLVARRLSGTTRVFLDAVDLGVTMTNVPAALSNEIHIGQSANPINGFVAQAAIYTTALSDARITAHYNARLSDLRWYGAASSMVMG